MSSKAWVSTLTIVLSPSALALAQGDIAAVKRGESMAMNDAVSTPDPTARVGVSSRAQAGRIALGLRLGYGLPMGSAIGGGDAKLSELVASQIPIQLDIGYWVIPNLLVGVYGQYAFGVLANDVSKGCDALGTDCRAFGMRLGLQGQYHFLPSERLNPWVGLGIGYEWNELSAAAGVDVNYHGFEFAMLQAGVDFGVTRRLGLGPFVSFSIGQYSSAASGEQDLEIRESAAHEWLTLGARGTFTL